MSDHIALANPNFHGKHQLRCLVCGQVFTNSWFRTAATKLTKHRNRTRHYIT